MAHDAYGDFDLGGGFGTLRTINVLTAGDWDLAAPLVRITPQDAHGDMDFGGAWAVHSTASQRRRWRFASSPVEILIGR